MTSYKSCVCLSVLFAEACYCLKEETVYFSYGIFIISISIFFWFHSKAKQFVPATSF